MRDACRCAPSHITIDIIDRTYGPFNQKRVGAKLAANQRGLETMKRSRLMIFLSAAALAGFSALAHASDKTLSEQLVGAWVSTSITDVYEDGHVVNSWGPEAKAAVIFDGKRHYIQTIIGADLSPPPPMVTPPQAKRTVVVLFGTYSVDEAASTVTFTADRSSEPYLEKVARTASLKLNGDELEQTSAPIKIPQGTFRPHFVWKRATQ
jgi:hypothetical protein